MSADGRGSSSSITSNVEDVSRQLAAARADDEAALCRLEKLLVDSDQALDVRLDSIDVMSGRLRTLMGQASELHAVLDGPDGICALAESVSSKVRALDRTRNRVRTAAQKVEDVLDARGCVDGVERALAENDLERAASYVERYRRVEGGREKKSATQSSESESGSGVGTLLEASGREQLRAAQARLELLVRSRLEEAVRQRQAAEIVRHCRLFAPLGRNTEGLQHYGQYLCSVLQLNAETIFARTPPPLRDVPQHVASALRIAPLLAAPPSSSSSSSSSAVVPVMAAADVGTYVQCCSSVLELYARVLERYGADAEAHFGADALSILMPPLQRVVERYVLAVLDLFLDAGRVPRLAALASSQSPIALTDFAAISNTSASAASSSQSTTASSSIPGNSGSGGGHAETLEMRPLADLLEALALLCNRLTAYLAFAPPTSSQQAAAATAMTSAAAAAAAVAAAGGEVPRRLQLLVFYYVELERYFLLGALRRAMHQDRLAPGTRVSSMVDHVFFVLQKCCLRAVTSSSANALCQILVHVQAALVDYAAELQRLLADRAQSRAAVAWSSMPSDMSATGTGAGGMGSGGIGSLDGGGGGGGGSGSEWATQARGYLVILNNLEVSSEYVARLRREVETESERVFRRPEDREKLRVAGSELGETARRLRALLADNLAEVATTLGPRLRSLVEIFAQVHYELSEQDFAELEAGAVAESHAWLPAFARGLDALLAPFRDALTPTNFDALLRLLLAELATRLEKALLQKRFNLLGGLQFDKDLRRLVAHVGSASRGSIRAEFARLTQIASLLNLERADEVLQLWGDNAGHLTWRLGAMEVRRVLSRRIDFSASQIAALKL